MERLDAPACQHLSRHAGYILFTVAGLLTLLCAIALAIGVGLL